MKDEKRREKEGERCNEGTDGKGGIEIEELRDGKKEGRERIKRGMKRHFEG